MLIRPLPDTPPSAQADGARRRDAAVALSLGLLLLAVYLASFSGALRSIDEVALFGATESFSLFGSLQPALIRFAPFHNPIAPYEPLFPILAAPFYAVAQAFSQVSNIHAILLLDPILTAATGSMLFLIGRRLRYGIPASLVLGLAFGLGSMAWPYARTFLREPAVGLLWAISFYGLAGFVERPGRGAALWAILPVLVAGAVKLTSLVAWPVVAGVLAWVLYRSGRVRLWTVILACGGVLALAGALGFALLLGVRGFDSNSVLYGQLINPFSVAGITPLYGLLFSPGKSIFIYSPVLLLGLAGMPRFWRRHRVLACGLVGLWVLLLVSLRSGVWWGGLAWGPRYLVPILGLSLLPALELFNRRWTWIVVFANGAFQALFATSAWPVAYSGAYAGVVNPDFALGLDWRRWADTPVFNLIRQYGRATLDVIWLRGDLARNIKLDPVLGAVLLAAVAAASGSLLLFARRHAARPPLILSGVAVTVAIAVLLARGYWDMPDYPGQSAGTARVLAETLSSAKPALGAIVNVSPDVMTYPWLGLVKGRSARTWISPLEPVGSFESLLPPASAPTLAVVLDRPHIGTQVPADLFSNWMSQRAYRYDSRWVDGYEVLYYALQNGQTVTLSAPVSWANGLSMTGLGIAPAVKRGSVLTVDADFAAGPGPLPADRFFAHLLFPGGEGLRGPEGALGASVKAGTVARERRGIWIPADAAPGEYDLIVGFANDTGLVRISAAPGAPDGYARVARVTVTP